MTSSQIIQISQNATDQQKAIGRRLELKILDILVAAHARVQENEKAMISSVGPQHLASAIDPAVYVDEPIAEIVEAAKGTEFEAHFAKPEVKTYLGSLLRQHFGTAIHIERHTFADKIPDHPNAQAYKQRYGTA